MGERTCRHLALFDGVLGADDQYVTATLVAPERGIGHKQRLSLVLQEWDAHPSKISGQEFPVFVLEARAHGKRSGRGINGGRRVIEYTLMRISLMGLQRPCGWNVALGVGRADAGMSHVGTDMKDVLFGNAEVDVDRVELNDGRKQSRGGPTADQFAK